MEMREVKLPAEMCDIAENKFRKRFGSLEELLTFVLRELLREDASQPDEDERKIVEERLRELGYI
jgi:hypothetical protein